MIYKYIIKGSLKSKLPTIWKVDTADEKQMRWSKVRRKKMQLRERQKREDTSASKGGDVAERPQHNWAYVGVQKMKKIHTYAAPGGVRKDRNTTELMLECRKWRKFMLCGPRRCQEWPQHNWVYVGVQKMKKIHAMRPQAMSGMIPTQLSIYWSAENEKNHTYAAQGGIRKDSNTT